MIFLDLDITPDTWWRSCDDGGKLHLTVTALSRTDQEHLQRSQTARGRSRRNTQKSQYISLSLCSSVWGHRSSLLNVELTFQCKYSRQKYIGMLNCKRKEYLECSQLMWFAPVGALILCKLSLDIIVRAMRERIYLVSLGYTTREKIFEKQKNIPKIYKIRVILQLYYVLYCTEN